VAGRRELSNEANSSNLIAKWGTSSFLRTALSNKAVSGDLTAGRSYSLTSRASRPTVLLVHPAVRTAEETFPEAKLLGSETDHSPPPSSAEFKNGWSCNSTYRNLSADGM
jgi:hypothetical protein